MSSEDGRRSPFRQPFYPAGRHDLLTTDIVGSGLRVDRNLQKHVRRVHYEILAEALDGVSIPLETCYREDRGDGAIVVPPRPSTARLVGDFLDRVNAALRRHNLLASHDARIRLRIAVHEGPVEYDGLGLSGDDVNHVFRLLDAGEFKNIVKSSDAALAFIASDHVYQSVIRHAPTTVDPDDFSSLEIANKETSTHGWVRLRGKAAPGGDAPIVAPPPPAPRAFPAGHEPGKPAERFKNLLDDPFTIGLRGRIDQYDLMMLQHGHTVQVFRRLVEAYVDTGGLLTEANREQLAVAYAMAEQSVVRQDMGMRRSDGTSGHIVRVLLTDLGLLTNGLRNVTDDDRETLREVVAESGLNQPHRLGRLRGATGRPTASLYVLFWGIAQLALLADQPRPFREEPDLYRNRRAQTENVREVQVDPDSQRVFLDVTVSTRQGFEDLMEGWHVVSQYLTQVEDLWRLSGLIAPPMRIFFRFPLWHDRNLKSSHFTVDPRSITGMLMGKALYGGRKHVWLRELTQNAIDATEMRSSLLRDAGHVPQVTIELLDSRHVTVRDNGIGMTYPQILSFLTTLGRSGWRSAESDEQKSEVSFIGRFGIGFASVFGVAKAVEVRTRARGQEGGEGWRVRFSDLDRPFFVEPTPCEVGTEVTVELTTDLSLTEFQNALRDLFVYLPDFVSISPARIVPSSLDAASALGERQIPPASATRVQRIDAVRIGTSPAVIKTELFARSKPRSRNRDDEFSGVPQTSLTVAVGGILTFKQSGVQLSSDGKSVAEHAAVNRHLGLHGCHVIIDFAPETAPILPSRDALDPDAFDVQNVSREICRQVGLLIPELVAEASKRASGGKQTRTAILQALESIVKDDYPWRVRTFYHDSSIILDSAARVYADTCSVSIARVEADEPRFALLGTAEQEGIMTAVLAAVAGKPAFSLYARARGMTSWIEVENRKELALLEHAWPRGGTLRTIDSTDKLFEDYESVFAEVKDHPLHAILRADYALSTSPLFGNSFFFRMPSQGNQISRQEGVTMRRDQLHPARRPRIVLNAEHPLAVALSKFLENASDDEQRELRTLLDSFCDGVVEDKSKQAPAARWGTLRGELERLVGTALKTIQFHTLELSI